MIKMNFNQSERELRLTVAVLLISVITMLPLGFSQTVKAQAPSKGPVQPRAESKGGQVEGIKVHGHWTIEVRNPDGTLVTRREFENGLVGASALAQILARQKTPGLWQINLLFSATRSAFAVSLFESNDPDATSSPNIFRTLTTSVINDALVLRGSATATEVGDFNGQVSTAVYLCPSSTLPGNCPSFSGGAFNATLVTSTSLSASPIHVVSGQIVQVSVTISFSSPPA